MTPPDGTSRLQQAAKGGLVALLVLGGLWTLHRYIDALVWASILAIAVWPFYRRTRNRWPAGRHDIILPACFTAVIALVVIIPLILVGIEAAREASTILDTIASARDRGIPEPAWLTHLPVLSAQASAWWQQHLASPESAQDLLDRARRATFTSHGREVGAMALHRMVLFGFTLLTLFFLFRDGDRLTAQMRRAGQRAFGPSAERIGRQMVASVHGTVDGLVLVGLGEGFILGVGYLAAGVPHPTLLGLFTAIAAMVPFGAPLAFGVAALTLVIQSRIGWAVGIVALGLVVTFAADHFIRPALIGKTTRLPFLWVLLGILGGVESWGLVGLFLGPAIMAALILLWREFAT